MTRFIILSLLSTLMLSNSDCKKKNNKEDQATDKTKKQEGVKDAIMYTGRLEVAGICKNYTISVIEGEIDQKLVQAEWTDEATKKNYTNAFRLGNPCNFPESIKAGDTFRFIIDDSPQKDCMVCMAYYPTPAKALSIKVVE